MTSITWDCPDEVRAAFEPYLNQYLHLVPGWCLELVVLFDTEPDEENGSLWVSSRPEYRMATIGISGAWLSKEEMHRRGRTVAHELVHLSLEPMADAFRDVLKATLGDKDEALRSWAKEQWRRAWEGAVCDLTGALVHRPTA